MTSIKDSKSEVKRSDSNHRWQKSTSNMQCARQFIVHYYECKHHKYDLTAEAT